MDSLYTAVEVLQALKIRTVLKIEATTTQIHRFFYFHDWVVNDSSWHLLQKYFVVWWLVIFISIFAN